MEPASAIEEAALCARDRWHLWSRVINRLQLTTVVEVGVFEGAFAQSILEACPIVSRYYMIDPWRHLDDWNKPANRSNLEFSEIRQRAMTATAFAEGRRIVLEGTTKEVSHRVPDAGVDFAYIDGDHTLRGITIDLIAMWPKLRSGAILAGDDFCPSIWQHGSQFEPTLVFPWAVHFAEAMECPIFALPFNQFAIVADGRPGKGFAIRDLTHTGRYDSTTLREALQPLSIPRAGRPA
jgi:Methyltransferase domain